MAGNTCGPDPKYKDPEAMQVAIDEYFNTINGTGEFPTVLGLVEALGFLDRRSLLDYADKDVKFAHTVKKAKNKIEKSLEKQLSGGRQVAGLIFNLKNNFGWVDKHEVDNYITGELSLTDILSGNNKG